MASVNMSQELRHQICVNYEKQLQVALFTESNVQEAVNKLIIGMGQDPYFKSMLLVNMRYQKLVDEINQSTTTTLNKKVRNNMNFYADAIIRPLNEMGIICNPDRGMDQNMTYLDSWSTPYDYKNYDGSVTEEDGSENYVPNDKAVKLDNLPDYYAPTATDMDYSQWRASGYAPYANCALLITDPKLCALFSPIGQIEKQVQDTVQSFKLWIDTVTTLKKFLDEVSGGVDLVPKEYLERFNKQAVKKPKATPIPTNLMPDALKKQLNEVILENKLLK